MVFHEELRMSWMRRCGHGNPGDLVRSHGLAKSGADDDDDGIDGEARAWLNGVGFGFMYFFELMKDMLKREAARKEDLALAATGLRPRGRGRRRSKPKTADELQYEIEIEALTAIAMNASSPLLPRIQELLRASLDQENPMRPLRILDVGSGPFSMIGFHFADAEVQVDATDIFGCEYGQIRGDLGIEFPNQAAPRPVATEDLHKVYGENAFDLVYCSNSLDHMRDPVKGLSAILKVVKPGKPVLLVHRPNVGVLNNYSGFHHWNLDSEAGTGRFLLWRPDFPTFHLEAVHLDLGQTMLDQGIPLVDVRTRIYWDNEGNDQVEAILWKA